MRGIVKYKSQGRRGSPSWAVVVIGGHAFGAWWHFAGGAALLGVN
jgi:hypothetical protein